MRSILVSYQYKIYRTTVRENCSQGRSEGVLGGGVVNPPNFCIINIFGKSGWPFGKLRQ